MALEDDEEYQKIKIESHKEFIQHILKGKSATEAYSLAFPNASRKTAGQHGHQLKVKYGDLLERSAPINTDKIEKIANQTLHNLTLMAFADLGGMIDKNGNALPLNKVPKPIRMAITEVEVDGKKIKYKIGGKTKAMEILSRVARLHQDSPEINISLITEEERDSKIKEIVVRAMSRSDDEGNE